MEQLYFRRGTCSKYSAFYRAVQCHCSSFPLDLYRGAVEGIILLAHHFKDAVLGIEACRQGIPVKFARTAALVNLLAESAENGRLSIVTKKLKSASIFILDEFGYVPYSRMGSQLLFEFLSELHEDPGKVVILNTNLEFSSWVNVLYDGRMAEALIGRLMHHCDLLLFPGENRRLREASAKKDYARQSDISFQGTEEARS